MGLETPVVYISDLNQANPLGSDPRNQGDDHIRNIKAAIKNTFPNINGAVNVTDEELNFLVGLSSNITTITIPAGTKMPFYQATPPIGFTAAAIQNDSMMRVVTSGTTGGTSGAGAGHSPILNNVVPSHTHTDSFAISNDTHSHTYNRPTLSGDTTGYISGTQGASIDAGAATSSDTHTHTLTGSVGTNTGAANWQPRYMDFCVGIKS